MNKDTEVKEKKCKLCGKIFSPLTNDKYCSMKCSYTIIERKRIENKFKRYVPPKKLDLETAIWLKQLLNKIFHQKRS